MHIQISVKRIKPGTDASPTVPDEGSVGGRECAALTDLYRYLQTLPEVQRNATLELRPQPDTMSSTLEVIDMVLSNAFSAASLVLAYATWLRSNRDCALALSAPATGASFMTSSAAGDETACEQWLDEVAGSPEGRLGNQLRQPDPRKSRAVIIGVGGYSQLPTLPSVRRTATDFAKLLTDKNVWGLKRRHCKVLTDPARPQAVRKAIRKAARTAEDALVVYFAGHGLVSDSGELYLALPKSADRSLDKAFRYGKVSDLVGDCEAPNKVVILDCCYAGRANGGGGGVADLTDRAAVAGTYLMAACSGDRMALAPESKKYTVFTGELIQAIQEGVPHAGEKVDMASLFNHVREQLSGRNLPTPEQGSSNQGHRIALVRNRQGRLNPRRTLPRRLWRRTAVAFSFVVALVCGVVGAPHVPSLWHRINPQDAGGKCADHATLLSFSDALDKKQVSEEKLEGLSALALTGNGEALTLTDNDQARLFPLRLGSATHLAPKPLRATTLRESSGDLPSKPFDGEGLVVERGGKTALVASEKGPSIERYRLSSGERLGAPLPIPQQFRTQPKGDAQAGRTLESLTASPDGRYLYTATEAPLAADGDRRGHNLLRIQRYRGEPGSDYQLDRQYAYRTSEGMYLADLATAGNDRLLALERQYVAGVGNSIHVYDVSLRNAPDVAEDTVLHDQPADVFLESRLLVNLANCPVGSPGSVPTRQKQVNPLLDNIEGMALGPRWTKGPYKGHRPLYLISDDNGSNEQITRVYALSVRFPEDG